MDIEQLISYPWRIMTPEFIILGVAVLLSLLDLFLKEKVDRKVLGFIALGGVIAALFFVLHQLGGPVQQILHDTYRLDSFASFFKIIFLLGAALVFISSFDYLQRKDVPYQGEYYYLILTGVLGAMIVASSADMITLFVGLELLSISSYILVAIRKKSIQSNESAFKYIVSGGIATAIMLYGMSFIYGLSGTTNLYDILMALHHAMDLGYGSLIYFAFFLTFVGMAFKISVVPFHMWAPDVYQGAPTPITAFLSVVSKAAGFALIIRFFLITIVPLTDVDVFTGDTIFIWFDVGLWIALAAAASMIIGNTMALRQNNVKRMFAYSSIAQAGFILVPFAIYGPSWVEMIIFYLIAYLLMNLGAFAIIQSVTKEMNSEEISSFAGLYKRSPFKALAMTVFLLSLAGLPVTAGFVGKFQIFMGAIHADYIWLVIVMALTTVISYFYYFGVVRQMYMRQTNVLPEVKKKERGLNTVVIFCFVLTILFGILPNVLLNFIHNYFNLMDMFIMVG